MVVPSPPVAWSQPTRQYSLHLFFNFFNPASLRLLVTAPLISARHRSPVAPSLNGYLTAPSSLRTLLVPRAPLRTAAFSSRAALPSRGPAAMLRSRRVR